MKVIKLNNHSMIGFINRKNGDFIQFETYELSKQEKSLPKFNSYKFNHNIQQKLKICDIILS